MRIMAAMPTSPIARSAMLRSRPPSLSRERASDAGEARSAGKLKGVLLDRSADHVVDEARARGGLGPDADRLLENRERVVEAGGGGGVQGGGGRARRHEGGPPPRGAGGRRAGRGP